MPTPVQPGSVQDTVDELEAEGFKVILNKVGSAGLGDCSVTAVRPGQTFVRTDSGVAGAMGDYIVTTLSKTVYVDVMC
jgi:hypothetical protein